MSRRGVLGIFSDLNATVGSIRRRREAGFQTTVLSPVPRHEIEEALGGRASPVRFFTLVGALLGCAVGFALAVSTSLSGGLITGGKPIVSIPPFLVVAFELAILFGALGTLLGLLINARLPQISAETAYEPRFSGDRFGLFVACPENQIGAAREMLRSSGAEEVQVQREENRL